MKSKIVFFISAFLLASTLCRADDTGSLSGMVTNANDGKPMAGVKISVYDPAAKKSDFDFFGLPEHGGGKPIASGTTDEKGMYTIDKLPPGAYEIEAGNQGSGFAKSKTKIVASQVTTLNLKIRPRHAPD